MMEQNLENCIRRLFEDVWNRRQTDLISEICSDDLVVHYGIEASGNRDQLRQVIDQWLEAFPDIQHEISDTIVQNNKTTVRWRGQGTHQASFMGIPATGKCTSSTRELRFSVWPAVRSRRFGFTLTFPAS